MEFTPEQQAYIDKLIVDAKTKWETDILQPVMSERDNLLQYKPVEKSDAEKALEKREQELFKKELSIELKTNGLEDFADFINVENVDELKSKIEALNKILASRKVNTSYVPDDHKQTSAYDQSASKNDVTGMISAKLSKLFN